MSIELKTRLQRIWTAPPTRMGFALSSLFAAFSLAGCLEGPPQAPEAWRPEDQLTVPTETQRLPLLSEGFPLLFPGGTDHGTGDFTERDWSERVTRTDERLYRTRLRVSTLAELQNALIASRSLPTMIQLSNDIVIDQPIDFAGQALITGPGGLKFSGSGVLGFRRPDSSLVTPRCGMSQPGRQSQIGILASLRITANLYEPSFSALIPSHLVIDSDVRGSIRLDFGASSNSLVVLSSPPPPRSLRVYRFSPESRFHWDLRIASLNSMLELPDDELWRQTLMLSSSPFHLRTSGRFFCGDRRSYTGLADAQDWESTANSVRAQCDNKNWDWYLLNWNRCGVVQ